MTVPDNAAGSRRLPPVLIASVVALVMAPYAVAGPNFHADDWVFVRNASFDGVLGAAGARQAGRPGAIVVYDLTFGAIGPHPLVIHLLQTVLLGAAAIAIHAALRRFVAPALAIATVLVWLVVPNHSTLEYWASTTQALVALTLVAVGVRRLAIAAERGERAWPAVVALAAAVACYEITLAAAAAAVVAVPWLVRGRIRWGIVARGAAVIAVPVAWLATHRVVYTVTNGRLDPSLVLPGNLSLGLAPYSAAGRLVTAVALAGALLALARLLRPSLRSSAIDAEQVAVAGLATVAVGVAPLVGFATNFIGMDDRLTVVSGVGASMVWVGVVRMAARDLDVRLLPAITAGLVVAIAVPIRVGRTADFVDAGDAAVAESHRFASLAQADRVVEVPGPVAVARRVDGLYDGWNATAATQALTGRRDVVVRVEIDGVVTGPPPDDPLATFR